MSKKPIVLKLGKDAFGDQAWGELEKIADVITIPESTTREQFLREVKDPQNKLSQVQVITRTARSVKNTGRFDERACSCFALLRSGCMSYWCWL